MKILFSAFLIMLTTQLFAQKPIEIELWPDGAPNTNELTGEEVTADGGRVSNVTHPTLFVYRATQPTGMAVIACPGGGYARLSMNNEGHDHADWYNAQGITFVVLKYRMPNGHKEVPLSDAEQAIRIVRSHAEEWGVDPHRVGIMGSSAGGHLAASLATLYSSEETRPDFQILFYPVITMQNATHAGSRDNLLGKEADDELLQAYSLETRVNEQTPPAFIMLSADDTAVPPVTNGIAYYIALTQNHVPSTLHCYPTGGHGWGYRESFTYKRQWTGELEKWLRLF